jgi:ribosomal protein S18 acetylase RimI-like enzyme
VTVAVSSASAPGRARILAAVTPDDVAEVRRLFREYADGLSVDLAFEGFDGELRTLPGAYAPPAGALLLARSRDRAVGCAGVRPFGPGECELKRLYVRREARGQGLGRRLVLRAVEIAERAGYAAMRLDTLPSMTEALALYPSLGFREVPEYRPNPVPGTRYFVRRLAPPGTSK